MCTSYFILTLTSIYLFLRLCLTWMFFVYPHWWVPLCLQRPAKANAFSTNYHACIAMPTWPRCAWMFFVYPHWWVPLCLQCPAKAMPFQQIIMHALQCQHDLDVHLIFCFDLDLHITSSRGRVLFGISSSILTNGYHFACSAQQKPCTCLLNNYHACIAIPDWFGCSSPILFWHWSSFNLFPTSCMTWIFFVDSHWWVPLCVQRPTIYVPFRHIIMYILQCPHDIHVHLFCFDLHKFLLLSRRAATCPTSNCGRGTSLFRQELV